MTEETTTLETDVRDAADQGGVEQSTVGQSTVDRAFAESNSFLNRAQGALTEAVGAVKEHPITAAGIAAGAAAAVAGAAYGASRLMSGEPNSTGGSKKKKS